MKEARPEKTSIQLDRVDLEIVRMLQEDGRQMYKDMAKKLHVSIPTIKNRITHLRELGVIKKFTVIIDPEKILGKIRVLLLIQVSPAKIDEVSQKLAELPEVREVYVTTGSVNLLAKIEVRDLRDLGEMVTKRIQEIPNITNISSLVITKVSKEEYGATVEPDSAIHIRCDFCKAAIVERPVIEFIAGGKYYFSSKDCAEAFKQTMSAKM